MSVLGRPQGFWVGRGALGRPWGARLSLRENMSVKRKILVSSYNLRKRGKMAKVS